MDNGTTPNAKRLLWAGFFAIFASGVGFGVRAGILVDWSGEYGFTQADLGTITGGGLTGFGLVIIAGSLIADRIGYGKLMGLAFVLHFVSAVMLMATDFIRDRYGMEGVYWNLYVSMFMFSVANGVCEVVVNPMVATLFPREKTQYLNILHAGWPGGLIAGGLIAYVFHNVFVVHWIVQISMYLIPTLIYGIMLLGQQLPRSEAGEAGVFFGEMIMEFASPILLLLLFIHALVGYVELGTDSWISRITDNIMLGGGSGLLLFIYTSSLMFVLRFCAGPIEHLLSPLGLLCISSILGAIGLTLLGNAIGVLMCVIAATVYACGKTFLWPTMLAVVSERFPKGGAVTMGMVGGVGMLSAGFLGGPGIGVKQDYYASTELKQEAPGTYERYAAAKPNSFYGIFETKGLDGTKVGLLEMNAKAQKKNAEGQVAAHDLATTLDRLRASDDPHQRELAAWWDANHPRAAQDLPAIESANLYGGRMALRLTAAVPATMAVLYLLLILYFKMRGGYKRVVIEPGSHAEVEVTQHADVQPVGEVPYRPEH